MTGLVEGFAAVGSHRSIRARNSANRHANRPTHHHHSQLSNSSLSSNTRSFASVSSTSASTRPPPPADASTNRIVANRTRSCAAANCAHSGDETACYRLYDDLHYERQARTASLASEADVDAIAAMNDVQHRIAAAVHEHRERRRDSLPARIAALKSDDDDARKLPPDTRPPKRRSAQWMAHDPRIAAGIATRRG
jgi:hypothetical protein